MIALPTKLVDRKHDQAIYDSDVVNLIVMRQSIWHNGIISLEISDFDQKIIVINYNSFELEHRGWISKMHYRQGVFTYNDDKRMITRLGNSSIYSLIRFKCNPILGVICEYKKFPRGTMFLTHYPEIELVVYESIDKYYYNEWIVSC